jgi:hypothetical protein
MPIFYWTKYSFNAPNQPLTQEAWAALRSTSDADCEEIIVRVKKERWEQFWTDHHYQKWFLGIFVGGLICVAIGENKSGLKMIGAGAMYLTFVGCLALAMEVVSHESALSKQCRYLRTEFGRAVTSGTYETYLFRYREIITR